MKTFLSGLLIAVVAFAFSGCSETKTANLKTEPKAKTETKLETKIESTSNVESETKKVESNAEYSAELHAPVHLEADGKPIDIGSLTRIGHAGPCVADIDCDGDRDLLVGDFPGFFWYFENTGNDDKPEYTSQGKFQAGGEDAKTPVY